MIIIYFITLFIAPQLWIEPFIGLRTDLFIYPIWLIYLAVNGKLNQFFKFNAQDVFFLLMIFWIIISSALNETNHLTTQIRIDYIKWFILYRFVTLTLATDDGIAETAKKMVFIVGIIVIEAIQHKFHPMGIGWAGQPLGWVDQSVLDAGGTGRTKWINIFDGPGVFCVMFTLILPFILIKCDKHFQKKSCFFSIVLMIPLLLAIWTTGSRGGFLATLAIFGAYILSRLRVSFFTILRIGILFLVVFMLAPSHLTQMKDDNNSAQHRVDMWMEGLEMLEQNPAFGIGKGNYASYTGLLIAHNSFIEVMGETGGPGVILWVGLIFLSFKTIYLYMQKEEDQAKKSYAKGLALSLIGYLVSSFFVTLEYETLYFLLGMARSLSHYYQIDLDYNKKDISQIILIVIGMYFLLKVFTTLYY